METPRDFPRVGIRKRLEPDAPAEWLYSVQRRPEATELTLHTTKHLGEAFSFSSATQAALFMTDRKLYSAEWYWEEMPSGR